MENFDYHLNNFVADNQKNINAYFEQHFPSLVAPTLVIDPNGKKYLRIVKRDHGSPGGSVFCFVEKETGNVFKAESWKRPAPGIRGHISQSAETSCTVYGAKYATR